MRSFARPSVLLLASQLLPLALLGGCKREPQPTNGAVPAPTMTVASMASAAPSAAIPSTPAPRRIASSTVVVSDVRPDLGLTLVTLPDGRAAVGYVGAKGAAAAIRDDATGWASAIIDTSAVDGEITAFDAKANRAWESVIPLEATGSELRVAVDVALTTADKRARLRCGPGAGAPSVVVESKASADAGDAPASDPLGDVRRCRTVAVGARTWTLVSSIRSGEAGVESVLAARVSDSDAGLFSDSVLATKPVPGNKLPVQERHVFDPAGAVVVEEGGWLVLARWGGHVVASKVDAAFVPSEPAAFTWLDVTAGVPALATMGRGFAYVVPALGKADLFGAAFPVEAKLPKPARVVAASLLGGDGDAGAAEEASSLGLVPSGEGYLFVWLQGKGAQRRARGAFVDALLAPTSEAFELDAVPASAVRAIARGDGKALVALLTTKGQLLALEVNAR